MVWRSSNILTDTSNKNPGSLYLKVKSPEAIKDSLKKLSNENVIELLTDSTTDWATNLFLYDFYKKDAFLYFVVIQTRKDWLPTKDCEIKYWRKRLLNR